MCSCVNCGAASGRGGGGGGTGIPEGWAVAGGGGTGKADSGVSARGGGGAASARAEGAAGAAYDIGHVVVMKSNPNRNSGLSRSYACQAKISQMLPEATADWDWDPDWDAPPEASRL